MIFPDAKRLQRVAVSADWLRGQFSVALRSLEAGAVASANHPCPYTDKELEDARQSVFVWLDDWMKAEHTAAHPEEGA